MRWIQPQLVDVDHDPQAPHVLVHHPVHHDRRETDLDRGKHQPGDDHHDDVGDPDDAGELEHDLRWRGAGNSHTDSDAGLEWSLHVGA